MTKKRIAVLVLSLLMALGGLGCVALSKYITPAEIDRHALGYAVETGVATPEDYSGYKNLYKAERLVKDVDTGHILRQEKLRQAIDRDNTEHNIVHGKAEANRQAGVQREELLFSEKGLFSMGLGMLGFGSFTGILGLMRKRPGDVTVEELETAVATVSGKTSEQLSAKDRQFMQVVKGLDEFMKTYKGQDGVIEGLKSIMNQYQDTDTQIAVQGVKKA